MEEKGISIFYVLTNTSGSAPEIYIHNLIYSPCEAYKADFPPQIRKLKIKDEIIHSGSRSSSLALRSPFFLLYTMALTAKVFTASQRW